MTRRIVLYAIPALLLAVLCFGVAQAQAPVHDSSRWHPPSFGHEHGDPVPEWVDYLFSLPQVAETFGGPLYAGDFSTSQAENAAKHAGMKGYHISYPNAKGRDGSWADVYVILHTFTNPMDRGSQFHSQRTYILDSQGATVRQSWVNYGDPATARVPAVCSLTAEPRVADYCKGYDAYQRPIVFVVDDVSRSGELISRPIVREQWYGFGGSFNWVIGVNATTRFTPGELSSDTDPHRWHADQMGLGQVRQLELRACQPGSQGCTFPAALRGQLFYQTQFGEFVRPDDPRCAKPSPTLCLPQYVSPGYQGIEAIQPETVYPLPADGVVLPN